MRKIIAAFDGLKYSTSTRDHAIALTRQTNAHLVGVFLDDRSYTGYKIYDAIGEDGLSLEKVKKFTERDRSAREKAVADFQTTCRDAGIMFSLHRDKGIAMQELKHESCYADLLIIGAHETFRHYPEKTPTAFIRHLLAGVQCPVLLVPEKFKPFQQLIALYDGSPASVHAIKMCSYIFPELKAMPSEVVTARTAKASQHLPDNRLIKEFMKRHYPAATYTILKGRAEEEITRYLKTQKENALVVLGAYHRNEVSRWFRESMADTLMKAVKMPLLIAHGQ